MREKSAKAKSERTTPRTITGGGFLGRYRAKRDFEQTPEPRGNRARANPVRTYVVQKHAATRLHYDFRLELNGVLLSWAVPKGPSLDPRDKRMAIRVEDHPLAYGDFEGRIPAKQYGGGRVIVWDRGTWHPLGDAASDLSEGKLVFELRGHKLNGVWELVHIGKGDEKQAPWLLLKKRDAYARVRAEYDVLIALPDSVTATQRVAAGPAAPQDDKRAPSSVPNPSMSLTHVRGAVAARLPRALSPQLATLANGVPPYHRWRFEVKYDGYRLMARIDAGRVALITRGGHDWSSKLTGLVAAIERMQLSTAWLDGEIVVLNDDGLPNFNALQKAFDDANASQDILYYLFDMPFFEGYDLRAVTFEDRRELLSALIEPKIADPIRMSATLQADPASIIASACRMNLEGVIAKRLDAPYVSRGSDTWLKLKCKQRQEFVICGYTDRSDGAPQIGSLLLGVHDDQGRLVSVGGVGTGWDAEEAAALKRKLKKIEVREPPFVTGAPQRGRWSKRALGAERWVAPRLMVEVAFADWTGDGQIRQAAYVGVRDDKPVRAIVRESAKSFAGALPVSPDGRGDTVEGIPITHGERVIDVSSGLTKRDVVRYYASVSAWILPHLKGRPCSLVRAPQGIEGPMFFQKHGERIGIPHITELPRALWPEHEPLLEVGNTQALIGAAQMNVLEFHTWNSTTTKIEHPDRVVFDLDPGEGTHWVQVQEAASLVRGLLDELGLQSWLKTSGGKGLHVVVPIAPRRDYDTVKSFSQTMVRHLAKTIPSRFVAKSGAANRVGKIFVDYLRNGQGATTAAAFSARARPGLGVSMPIAWTDLHHVKSGAQFTVMNARDHLSFQSADPWAAYWQTKQTLTRAMQMLTD